MGKTIHDVEINFPSVPGPEFSFKIDGKDFGPTSGIKIFSPLANKSGLTIVEITLYANVRGKIKGKIIKKNA